MTPLFTVVIPTYQRPALLNRAIESVLEQTVSDLECIVVDDGSPTPATTPTDDRVRLIRCTSNRGAAAARNVGLRAAVGRYVCFLDDDDTFLERRLDAALTGLEKAPVAICWRAGDPNGSCRRMLNGDVYDSILDAITPHLGQVAIEHEVAPEFDETYAAAEDVEWWLRVAALCRVATVSEIGLRYRHHAVPRHGNGLEQRIRCSIRLLEDRRAYFVTHRRAAAFRWRRIGVMAVAAGDMRLARTAFHRSLRAGPSPKTLLHLARSVRPSRARIRVPTERGTSGIC